MLRVWVVLLFMAPGLLWAQGDPQRGEELSAICSACHGPNGNSVVPAWPKLAGQHQDYAARQSILIRERQRDVPEMWPMVMDLSDQDLWDLAAYYEQFEVEPGVADESLVDRGRSLYMGGNHSAGVAACAGCHGPAGYGIPGAHYPKLRGQHAEYTADRLRRYRAGEHNGDNDPFSHIMVAVARNLSDADIEALASYIEGLHMGRFDAVSER